jgi:hypothetical protein
LVSFLHVFLPTLHEFVFSPMLATFPAHPILFGLIIQIRTRIQIILSPPWVQIFSSTPCSQTSSVYVGFEVLTAVVMKSTIFWDMTPCSPVNFNRRFGGTNPHHLQGRRISRARNQKVASRALKMEAIFFFRNVC